jgi:hypothetical protein
MQRDSKQRLLRYSGIIADCRVAFTVLKILQYQWDASDEWLSMTPAARYPHQRALTCCFQLRPLAHRENNQRRPLAHLRSPNSRGPAHFRRGPESDFRG